MPGHPFVPPATAVPSPVQHKALQVCVLLLNSLKMHRIGFGSGHTAEQKDEPPSSPHAARPGDSKWSPSGGSASNSSLAHELWKVPLPTKALSVAAPTRPPPGLTSQKLSSASSGWDSSALRLGGWGSSSESRYTPGKNRNHACLNTLVPEIYSGFSNFNLFFFFKKNHFFPVNFQVPVGVTAAAQGEPNGSF